MDMDKKDSKPEGAVTHILVNPDAHGLDHGKPYFHLLYAKELGLTLILNHQGKYTLTMKVFVKSFIPLLFLHTGYYFY